MIPRRAVPGLVIAPLVIALLAGAAPAQPETAGMDARALELAGLLAVREARHDDAEAYFLAQAEQTPGSFEPWYNLCAVACRRAEPDLAMQRLTRAITLGFTDARVLRSDPDLAPIRERPDYRQILDRWREILDARRDADRAFAGQLVPKGRENRTIERWKLDLISSHDPVSTDETEREIALICDWSARTLFNALKPEDALRDDPWCVVVLPDRAQFALWGVATFGPGARAGIASIGGAYEHNRRRLVAQDLGATLRHELIHVMHWRDMSRLGQQHAPWVQEGLASLVEDYDIEDGRLVPAPSWRTNIVKRLADTGRLTPIEELAATPMDRFVASRPLAKYAQARAVMLFLLDRGKLDAFYRAYTASFERDPTALTALRDTLAMDQNQLERAYRDWLTALPMVAETGRDLPATLGIEIENGTGDGVRVTDLPPGARNRTGLRLGSFITHIDRRPTRDLGELIRVLADYAPGQTVTLTHRFGRVHNTSEVVLLPRD